MRNAKQTDGTTELDERSSSCEHAWLLNGAELTRAVGVLASELLVQKSSTASVGACRGFDLPQVLTIDESRSCRFGVLACFGVRRSKVRLESGCYVNLLKGMIVCGDV